MLYKDFAKAIFTFLLYRQIITSQLEEPSIEISDTSLGNLSNRSSPSTPQLTSVIAATSSDTPTRIVTNHRAESNHPNESMIESQNTTFPRSVAETQADFQAEHYEEDEDDFDMNDLEDAIPEPSIERKVSLKLV